jgi:DNA-binding winged helix-turn-helix (wHTH) protein
VIVAFDDLELDLLRVGLRRRGVRVRVERQVFEVLAYLVNHRERVVTKQELMDSVWGGRFVSESAVTSRVKQVRQAVGDDGHTQRLVRTVHGHGYRFVGTVRVLTRPPTPLRRSGRRCRAGVHRDVHLPVRRRAGHSDLA